MEKLWNQYRNPEQGFISRLQAANWPEGLLIGNGTIGAIVMGHPQKECLIVTHEELFLPVFERRPVLEMKAILPELRAKIRSGRYREASERVVEAAREVGYPKDFIMTDPSHPAFDLVIDSGPYEGVREYLRSVNFATGEACISYKDERGARWLKRSFVSRADGLLVCRVECEAAFDADITLAARPGTMEPWDPGRTSAGFVPKGTFATHGFRLIERNAVDGELTYRALYAKSDGGYGGMARITSEGGEVRSEGTAVHVAGASSINIVATVKPLSNGEAGDEASLRRCIDGSTAGYDEMLARHVELHGDFFGRVRLVLGDGNPSSAASEDLILEAQRGEPSPDFISTVFDACRHNILCSSGTLPPNLQGVWSGTWTPHWSGDYTLDANVQAAIAHYLSCDTPELMEGLFSLMDKMMPDFRENAKALFGARGFFVNSRVSTTGLQQRYNTCPMYFWTAGAAWIAHYYFDYYLYTGDEEFLEGRALPFMEEAALFYEDFLVEGEDGCYELIPSVSPENHPANTDSLVCLNATMDVAACRELLGNLLRISSIITIDTDKLEKWRRMLSKLPPYEANSDGALKEWLTDALEDNYGHRHMSHLYPLYPGDEADADETPELHEMVLRAFQKRMEHYDPREYGGFGLYHVAMAAARAGDAETAWNAVKHMAQWHMYSGMGTSHNHGPTVFNLDASGGIPAALVEMFVVSRPGKIRLLPAVPKALGNGMLSGACCRGGVKVDHLEWDLRDPATASANATLSTKVNRKVGLSVPAYNGIPTIEVAGNRKVATQPDGGITVALVSGTPTEIIIRWM